MHSRNCRVRIGTVLALLTWSLLLIFAAEAQESSDYSKGVGPFPNFVRTYAARGVPLPRFGNTPRISQLIQNGDLMLSLDDAIALALENNLDLAIARYNLPIADTDILRTRAGLQARGVSTGLVSGTPGGTGTGVGAVGSGSGAGGTTTAMGGAATGTGGLVTSTSGAGPSVPPFDPFLSVGLNAEHSALPQSNTVTTGVSALQQNQGTANFSYNQSFVTGTSLTVSVNNSRTITNSLHSVLVPSLNSNVRVQFTQPLLQGFGMTVNRRFLITARNNREITDIAFRLQVITTVSQIQNIYWDLVNAYEDVRVKRQSQDVAKTLLADTEKQVKIGILAPIEIVRSKSALASADQDLVVSETNLQLQELLMKNAVSRNLTDPTLASAHVVPTSTIQMPALEPVAPIEDLINEALSNRPELAESRVDLANRDLTTKAARNGLLPAVDLVGWYGSSALAGNFNSGMICTAGESDGCTPLSAVPARTGFTDLYHTMFANTYRDYAVGFNINIPIRNRSAQADQMRSELEYRQAQMRLAQLQNQIRIEVRNAQFAVQQNRARVDAATTAVELARQTLDAEQKKYAFGVSTNTVVLQTQRDLAQAESNAVLARTTYGKSRVEFDRATARTLNSLGIDLGDAESGSVSRLPSVPGIVQVHSTP
ncbi:MAG TPA: TolC family protein [Terriglobales bacterium]|nr:TolC family protein [Terriglobales bacterium]